MSYGQFMTKTNLITAAEATDILGYQNRSSLTRLVQSGRLSPAFTASGKRGEQFFNRSDVEALLSSPVSASPEAAETGDNTTPAASSPPVDETAGVDSVRRAS